MAFKITIPESGELGEDIVVVSWLIDLGETVSQGEPVAEIEAEKGVLEIEAVMGGTLLKITAVQGDSVRPGGVIGYIGEPGEVIPGIEVTAAGPASGPKAVSEKIQAVPAARKLAAAHGIDLSAVKQTGPKAVIKKSDVEAYLENLGKSGITGPGSEEIIKIPLTRNQKIVAARVSESYRDIPSVRFRCRVDMTRAIEARKGGGYDGILVFCSSRALLDFPLLYSRLEEKTVTRSKDVNIGMAVGIGEKLFVPVIKNAAQKKLKQLVDEINTIIKRLNTGPLKPAEMSGGNFLVSNLSMYPVTGFDAIIHPGQSAALSCGAVSETPFRGENGIFFKPVMEITLTVDHRLINGRTAAGFLKRFKQIIERLDEWLKDE
jgi:pyruvate dehydrogenase E2 component (dihydrolipoamide acetyltransferase)